MRSPIVVRIRAIPQTRPREMRFLGDNIMASFQDHWVRKLLASASIVAMTSMGATAFAQDDTTVELDEDDDEVIVTGFKQSLQRAQDIKLNADTFVDAITAEDIGALPDRSVAEALQRVPGVNISRFSQADDPDRFSVEGSGVIVRGLPFVRSELNGREVFSANGGRNLSFNDVSPELLGGVEVFKNTTADMVDGGISGTVNLITRKPLDELGPRFAGTVEANYGDLAEEVSPAFSGLISHSYETKAGAFGLQLGYAQSELVSRTDASQVTDPCYRDASLTSGCIRVRPVGSGGFSGDQQFNASNFPPAGTVIVPKGAGIRTNTFDRDRSALSLIGQWESPNRELLVTAEYLRADADQRLDEYSILALVNNDAIFPIPVAGTTFDFDANGVFQSGALTTAAGGIETEALRFNREDEASTQDYSLDIKWNPTERLGFNFEVQKIKSARTEDGIIGAMQTLSDIFVDNSGEVPDVEFRGVGGAATTFDDPDVPYFWFMIDNQVANDGKLQSYRADVDYELDRGLIQNVRFGARWADRDRQTRTSDFSNWGNLSAPWVPGGAVTSADPAALGFGQLRTPFADFQRGTVTTPIPGGAAFFTGGDDFIGEYLGGLTSLQAASIIAQSQTFNPWNPLNGVFRNVSDVEEQTLAFYGRADFAVDNGLPSGMTLDGNFGLRYVETTVKSDGAIRFPDPAGLPDVTLACDPANVNPGSLLPGFCGLNATRLAEFQAAFTGELVDDDSDISFEHWLPSFNAKLGLTDEILFRFAVSKGISRPDLSQFRTGGVVFDNTNNLRQAGTLDTGPLFGIGTGNRLLEPVESWNFDVSGEWYFDDVGSLTVSLFYKDLDGLITGGPTLRDITRSDGTTNTIEVNGPANEQDATLKGFEIAYQQVFDFLPGLLSDFGAQATYTYVDASDISNSTLGPDRNPFAAGLGLAGVSENTFNLVGFYENDRISARLAYNWRSEYALTPRDVIFPFNPILGESTGQLDGSFFVTVTDDLKLGVQAVNLLDEVTNTRQVIDFDGTSIRRSGFRNDRRFSFIARFDF